jgi:hypothetical protein
MEAVVEMRFGLKRDFIWYPPGNIWAQSGKEKPRCEERRGEAKVRGGVNVIRIYRQA